MHDDNFNMVGDPCYQAYRNMDYKVAFNNSDDNTFMHTKILLNLPMVPPRNIDKVRLTHVEREHK